MNAYLIQDDDHYVIVAKSMQSAVAQAERIYIAENYDPEVIDKHDEYAEARDCFRDMLQSCALVGPVKK